MEHQAKDRAFFVRQAARLSSVKSHEIPNRLFAQADGTAGVQSPISKVVSDNDLQDLLGNLIKGKELLQKQQDEIRRSSRRKTLVFQAYKKNRKLIPATIEEVDLDNDDYEGSSDFKFPPTNLIISIIALFFSLPLGLYAVIQATMVKSLIQKFEVRKARYHSIKSHRYATLAICHGLIFVFVALIVFCCSKQLQQALFAE